MTDRLCRDLARLGLKACFMKQCAGRRCRGTRRNHPLPASPSGVCGSGAGAEASTTGAWKSTWFSRLRELGELEAALQELVCARRRQRESAGVPALELRKPAARADLGLDHAHVALGEHDLRLDISRARRAPDATRSETR